MQTPRIGGITFVELLLIVGVVAVLAAIVVIALRPVQPSADVDDAQRRDDTHAILTAVYQYAIEHNGTVPQNIPMGTAKEICRADTVDCDVMGVDLSVLVPQQIQSIPVDPQSTGTGAGYTIVQEETGRIAVCALKTEGDESICAVR